MADDNDTNTNDGASQTDTIRMTSTGPAVVGTGSAGLDAALDREDARSGTSAVDRAEASRDALEEERETLGEGADITPASNKSVEASGAIMEPKTKAGIDVDHPAVDNNPRAGTTVRQNSIDFNDPTLSDRQAVEQRLTEQDGDYEGRD